MALPNSSAAVGFIRNLMIASVLLVAAGCASGYPPPPNPLSPAEATFDVPPKQMVETVKQTLSAPPMSLPVEVQDNGTLLTGYQPYPGEWHILRRWQEQTRFKISVIPDWEQPTQKCRVQVVDETQTRATNGQTWDPATDVDRRDRAKQIIEQIRAGVKK